MEEARKALYERAIKTFTLRDIARHKDIKNKNLVELISRYPGFGKGFKVYKKTWPVGTYAVVKKVDLFVMLL